jgi:guanosine-3',5'-bis(diphosphate) 3'-pyrophosphohydrolase
VVEAVYPTAPIEEGQGASLRSLGPPVRGVRRGAAVRMCEHCRPIPGDRIVGIAKDSTGVVVHAIDCPLLAEHEDSVATWLDLRWDEDADNSAEHVARIDLTLANEPGALGIVCGLIGEQRANIDNIMVTDRKPDFFRVRVDLEVRDVKHLAGIVTSLEAQAIVNDVMRPRAHPADEAA